MEEKEKTFNDWYDMIKKSWTYEKFTEEEKEHLNNILTSIQVKNILKGTSKQRWNILQAIYYSYLIGLGYNSPTWRQ